MGEGVSDMEGNMERDEALSSLRSVEELARRTERRLTTFWRPAALWGLLALGSVPFAALPGPRFSFSTWQALNRALNFYLIAALAVGVVGSIAMYRSRALKARPSVKTLLIALAILLLTPVGGIIVGGGLMSSAVGTGWYVAIAAATLVTGWITRNKPLAIVSLPLVVLAWSSMFFASHAPIVLSSLFAAGYLATAALERRGEREAA